MHIVWFYDVLGPLGILETNYMQNIFYKHITHACCSREKNSVITCKVWIDQICFMLASTHEDWNDFLHRNVIMKLQPFPFEWVDWYMTEHLIHEW